MPALLLTSYELQMLGLMRIFFALIQKSPRIERGL